ncbi:MAG: O-antigen ligase family protein [Candidatus Limnocylindria bacterium]
MAERAFASPQARDWTLVAALAGILACAVLLALAVGGAAGFGQWEASVAIALAVPMAIVVINYPWAAVMIWLGLMPFLVTDASSSVSPGVWATHRLMIAATMVIVLTYRMLGLSRSRFRLSMVDVFVVGFVVLGVANVLLLSSNPIRMLVAFFDTLFVPITLFWLIRLVDPGSAEIRRLVPVLAMVLLVQIAIGILSWVAPGVLPGAWLGRAGERTIGTLGGPGPYTVTLVFGALIMLHAGSGSRLSWVRWAMMLLAAAAFVGVLLSLSRGSWLGAGAAGVGLFFVFPRSILPTLGAGAIVALALAVGPLSSQFGVLDERVGDVDTAESRLLTNNAAVRMIATEPGLGFGYGNFERFDESFKERMGDIAVKPGSAHHAYLALAAENGLPALVLYLLPAGWLLMRSIQLRRYMPTEQFLNGTLLVVLWLALLDQFIVSNFMDMLHSSAWGVGLWWICLGLIHALVSRAAATKREFEHRGSSDLLAATT